MDKNQPKIGYETSPGYIVLSAKIADSMICKFEANSARYTKTAQILTKIMDRT